MGNDARSWEKHRSKKIIVLQEKEIKLAFIDHLLSDVYLTYITSISSLNRPEISEINSMNLPNMAQLASEGHENSNKSKCASLQSPHSCHYSRLPVTKDIIIAAGSWKPCWDISGEMPQSRDYVPCLWQRTWKELGPDLERNRCPRRQIPRPLGEIGKKRLAHHLLLKLFPDPIILSWGSFLYSLQ